MITREQSVTSSLSFQSLQFDCSTNRAGLLLNGQSGLVLRGLTIEVQGDNANQAAGIYLRDCQDIWVDQCEIRVKGSGAGILALGGSNIRITNCTVTLPEDSHTRKTQAIQLRSILPGVQKDSWRDNKVILRAEKPLTGVLVSHCQITNGYYGIGVSCVDNLELAYNRLRGNMRGISIQDGSDGFRVYGNSIRENVSAGIHCAFGSSNGKVFLNDVVSSVAKGEAHYQAYVGCKNISFWHNYSEATGTGPKWHLYLGVASTDIHFYDNLIKGPALRATIGAESEWSSTIKDPRHRCYGTTADDGLSHGKVSGSFRWNRMPSGATTVTHKASDFPLDVLFTQDNITEI